MSYYSKLSPERKYYLNRFRQVRPESAKVVEDYLALYLERFERDHAKELAALKAKKRIPKAKA